MNRCGLFFFALGAFAHDLYLMPAQTNVQPGQPLVVAAHVGDSFPASESPIDPRRVVQARLLTDGTAIENFRILGRATWGTVTIGSPGSHVLGIGSTPKFLELEAAKFESYLKEEGLDGIMAWRAKNNESARPGRELYSKYAKTLVTAGSPSDGYQAQAGYPIEILLEADPTRMKPGDTLPIRVLWKDQPAAGLQVELAWSPADLKQAKMAKAQIVGRTDAEGRLRVQLDQPGRFRLHTVAMERHANPAEADWKSVWASFTFEMTAATVSSK
ncbi:MAG: DUF4198 domain-containing protein [Bryobacteraceae bacterium]|nr:DUF4198 domain-containing protein [Bryobacteraceae bacterium]